MLPLGRDAQLCSEAGPAGCTGIEFKPLNGLPRLPQPASQGLVLLPDDSVSGDMPRVRRLAGAAPRGGAEPRGQAGWPELVGVPGARLWEPCPGGRNTHIVQTRYGR